ncbi:MAG: bZIP transcription factor [Halopenitus sp.]
MSNRVEELERQVAELQAAVNGLTEELVEMKERVRQVEDANETDVRTEGSRPVGGSTDESSTESTSAAPGTEADEEASTEETDSRTDDIRVPEQEATTPDAEATKAEEGKESADADGESDESDIIVA